MCQDKRGVQTNLSYSGNRAVINYELPLNEVVFDFNDRLKSMTSGYASFDYEIIEHREGDLVKLGILVNALTKIPSFTKSPSLCSIIS